MPLANPLHEVAPPSADLVAALADPATYGVPGPVELCQTHISWVFLAGDRAYKLKKPVTLPFLDYGTPERRRTMCREEVRLNRALAPEVYLGVRGVVLRPDGARLTAEGDPAACDHVVEMRRFADRDTLDARLARGAVSSAEVRAVARRLAAFHREAAIVPDQLDPIRTLENRLLRNLAELLAVAAAPAEHARVLALAHFTRGFLGRQADELCARARSGRTREGHGDIRVEHVLLDPSVQIVDCLEFDPALRRIDVAEDLAFLVMELAERGARKEAEILIDAYRDAGGDPGSPAVLAFYAAQRAVVRAKVALVRAAQLDPGSREHRRSSLQGHALTALAERFAWRARRPLVIVVCGVPASGKSTLAARLGTAAGLPHLSSDQTRKALAGIEPAARAPRAAYTPSFSKRTYAALGRGAARAVQGDGGAIVDATFRHRSERAAFAAALGDDVPVVFVECLAPGATLARRAADRASDPARVSDAGPDVVARERGTWEPLDEVPGRVHVALRTDRPQEELLPELIALLDTRLGRAAGA